MNVIARMWRVFYVNIYTVIKTLNKFKLKTICK